MPYAAEGIVSQAPLPGGIQITDEQYRNAIEGMQQGLHVSVSGGFRLVAPPADIAPAQATDSEQPEAAPADALKELVQLHLDNTARSFGYDDIKAVVTYAEEPSVPKYQREGRAFRAWRSQVWAYVFEQMERMENGERDWPSMDAFAHELPELVIQDDHAVEAEE